MLIFKPKHFPRSYWSNLVSRGYHLKTYLDIPQTEISSLDAEGFLREAWGMFVSYEELADTFCVIAKILAPDGRSVCVRMDRDFMEIYKQDCEGVATLATWQFSCEFRGFRKDELWANMVDLMDQAK